MHKFTIPKIIVLIFLSVLFYACGTNRNLYSKPEQGKIIHGILNDSIYLSVRNYCQSHSPTSLKDTIIIKYDFNHESCWNTLDLMEESRIRNAIDQYNSSIAKAINNRPGISVFQFREAGNHFNKYKKWNTEIITDSTALLGKKIFYQKVLCGNSAIILPDKRFLLIRSDSHFEALTFSSETISKILAITTD